MEKQNIPSLRFPEFEGEWKLQKMDGEISSIHSGWSPDCEKTKVVNDEWGVLKTTSVDWSGFNEDENKRLPEDLAPRDEIQVAKGDILITRAGPQNRVGVVAHVDDVIFNLMLSDKIIRIKVGANDSKFFSFLLGTPFVQCQIQSKSSGLAVSQTNISQKIIREAKIVFPHVAEQQKIAAFLSAVDQKIQALKKKKELLAQYKKGMMQKLFSQELRFKPDGGGDFPEWEEKKLGEVAVFSKGKGISKNDISENGTTECIRYGQLYTHYFETISKVISRTNVAVDQLVLSRANDVIIPASGETQIDIAKASCVLTEGVALGGDLNIIRSNSNGVFMSYYLNGAKRNEIASLAQGSSVMHLYASQLTQLNLEVPSLAEQNKIANSLSAIDEKIAQVQTQIEKSEHWKKGLLQQMFV